MKKNTYNLGFYDADLKKIHKQLIESPDKCWFCNEDRTEELISFNGTLLGVACDTHKSADFLYD